MSAARPYVGLDYFHEEDAGLFFGRDAERKRIIGNLRASRLTLLYARERRGKELAAAGGRRRPAAGAGTRAAPRSAAARFVPVVFSTWRGDPTALSPRSRRPRGRCGRDGRAAGLRRDALEAAIEDVARQSTRRRW